MIISEDERADPTKPTGGPDGAVMSEIQLVFFWFLLQILKIQNCLPSCGNRITLLGSDGGPSPTLFTALTRN